MRMLSAHDLAMLMALSFLSQVLKVNCGVVQSKLLNDILASYDKRVKPDPPYNYTLEVEFDSSLMQIIDVDEKNQMINTITWNEAWWTDERLAWNPEDYDGITSVVLHKDSIWLPHIMLYNTVDVVLSLSGWYTTEVKVFHEGLVHWEYFMNSKSSCSMNLRFYPFDVQNCSLEFLVLEYWAEELNFTINQDPAPDDDYSENSEFKLLNQETTSLVLQPFPNATSVSIYYTIRFQRRLTTHVMNMILPCCLISIVAMLSFYIPSDSGEKTGIGVTVLLSMTVFLLILRDQMPPTSDFPLIGIYYFGVMLMITLSTSLSVFVLTIHHRAAIYDQDVPLWLRKLCFQILAKLLCLNLGDEDLIKNPKNKGKYESTELAFDDSRTTDRTKVYPINRVETSEADPKEGTPSNRLKEGTSSNRLKEGTSSDRLKEGTTSNRLKEGTSSDRLKEGTTSDRLKEGTTSDRLKEGTPSDRLKDGTPSDRLKEGTPLDRLKEELLVTLQDILKAVQDKGLQQEERLDVITTQWKRVAYVVDRLLLIIFIFVTVIFTSVILLVAALNGGKT